MLKKYKRLFKYFSVKNFLFLLGVVYVTVVVTDALYYWIFFGNRNIDLWRMVWGDIAYIVVVGAGLTVFVTYFYTIRMNMLIEKFGGVLLKISENIAKGKYKKDCKGKDCVKSLKLEITKDAFRELCFQVESAQKQYMQDILFLETELNKRKEFFKEQANFITIVSHKMRTPSASIRWNVEMLLDGEFGKLNNNQAEVLSDITMANERTIFLINDLIKISAINSEKFKLKPENFSLKICLQEAIREFNFKIKAHNIKVKMECVPACLEIITDKRVFKDIVSNLIDNAIKYSSGNKGKGRVRVGYKLVNQKINKKDKRIIVFVSDNGVGIPEEDRAKIFTKFFRGSNVLSLDTEGTGLGLAVTHDYVGRLGGKIWFDSDLNKGTTFYVDLPLEYIKKKKSTGFVYE